MELLVDEHIELLERLTEASVEFILIGGYSVIYYGYSRTTNDMDLWLKPDNSNKDRFLNAIKKVVYLEVKSLRIPVVDYYDLITMKMLSNRLKDKADIEELQRINKYRKK